VVISDIIIGIAIALIIMVAVLRKKKGAP
jgi:hypothetical protein